MYSNYRRRVSMSMQKDKYDRGVAREGSRAGVDLLKVKLPRLLQQVEVCSISSFQGREAGIIVFSRSNEHTERQSWYCRVGPCSNSNSDHGDQGSESTAGHLPRPGSPSTMAPPPKTARTDTNTWQPFTLSEIATYRYLKLWEDCVLRHCHNPLPCNISASRIMDYLYNNELKEMNGEKLKETMRTGTRLVGLLKLAYPTYLFLHDSYPDPFWEKSDWDSRAWRHEWIFKAAERDLVRKVEFDKEIRGQVLNIDEAGTWENRATRVFSHPTSQCPLWLHHNLIFIPQQVNDLSGDIYCMNINVESVAFMVVDEEGDKTTDAGIPAQTSSANVGTGTANPQAAYFRGLQHNILHEANATVGNNSQQTEANTDFFGGASQVR
ncbi:hypothetical protein B0T17DRAFT_510727 [Bombardia bombarda]|uniref:Uncharacterized protein n=1 Tax=Bombardia bombarda TaxID=252184 RepID=A0AA39WGC8_9PEZI|nr:hypothetical protein B0T17DRAFT_510727 [Bombardia bombarda]